MKVISTDMQAHVAQAVTTLAMCWKVTRRDGIVLGFTNHDRDIVVSGVTYLASAGMSATSVHSSIGLAADNLDIEGVLSNAAIAEADILAGKYDFAEMEVFMVNYANVSEGVIHLKTGWLGEVVLKGGQFIAELRGISEQLQRTIGEVYTPTCRAVFGDSKCRFDATSVTFTGTMSIVNGAYGFSDSTRAQSDGYFDYGVVTVTSGANIGLVREVKNYQQKSFVLFQALPYPLIAGTSYSVVAGCDKRLDTCRTRFNNTVNFRGEPHVPGTDRILETAATRSI
jgi:uncharacterized phage protein (TIGR02218 family)